MTLDGVLAVDIGGTKTAVGVVLPDASIVVRDRIATPTRDPWPSIARVVSRVLAAAPDVRLTAVGVGCGGPMDDAGVSPLHIPTWRNFPLREAMVELTGLPVLVDNDAKTFALAEGWRGAASGHRNFLGVIIGTGVGAGLVVNGRLAHGDSRNAGHIGHVVVEPGGKECRCGALGCLEAYLAGRNVADETGSSPRSAAGALIERNGRLLGRALASVVALTSIDMAVIGGGVALGWGDPFIVSARREYAERARLGFAVGIPIEMSRLGERAGLIGAAALALGSAS